MDLDNYIPPWLGVGVDDPGQGYRLIPPGEELTPGHTYFVGATLDSGDFRMEAIFLYYPEEVEEHRSWDSPGMGYASRQRWLRHTTMKFSPCTYIHGAWGYVIFERLTESDTPSDKA